MAISRPCSSPILHVTTVHGPLDVRIFYKEVRALANAGYDVRLATTVDAPERHDGVPFLPLGNREGSRWRRLLRDVRALVVMLQQPGATIIHIHDPELIVAAAIPSFFGKRIVYDVHEFYSERIADSHWIPRELRAAVSRAYDTLERSLVRRFAGVVIVSDAMRSRYQAIVDDESIALVRNFPYITQGELESARQSAHPLGGLSYVLHTGGASELRAFHTLVAAAELLRKSGCDSPVINLGATDLSAYPPDVAHDLLTRAKSADVRNLGIVSQAEAWRYVAHASVGYMPLVAVENNIRGMPNKLFEYLYFGLPIVATGIGRTAEIVTETAAGILVSPENAREDAEAILRILENPDLASDFRSRSQRAGRDFTFAGEFDRLALLYSRIDARRGSHRAGR